jgi:hypothetical protein
MPKLDLMDFLMNDTPLSEVDFKASFGKKDFPLFLSKLEGSNTEKAEALIKLGNEFENRTNQEFGFQKIYKPLICYIYAAKLLNLNGYKAIHATIRKQLFRHDFYDKRFEDLLEASYKKAEALKELISKRNSENTINDPQLNSLLQKISQIDNVPLAERLDVAFELYKYCYSLLGKINEDSQRKEITKVQAKALKLMETILNTEGEKNIFRLMNDRLNKRKFDPEYLPGKKPKDLTRLPDIHKASTKLQFQWRRLSELALAKKKGKILTVRDVSRDKDLRENTQFLTPQERDAHRVIIRKGKFYERQEDNEYLLSDTRNRVSHEKSGFAAYTLNLKGELSLFDHFEMADGFAHSSMNAQAPVFCAGEIKLLNGELQAITVYSRHYNPTLQNIYELLAYFKEQGVDISKTVLHTWGPNNHYTANVFIDYNAKEFFDQYQTKGITGLRVLNQKPETKTEDFDDFETDFEAHLPSISKPAPSVGVSDSTASSPHQKSFEEDFEVHFPDLPQSSHVDKVKSPDRSQSSQTEFEEDFEVDFDKAFAKIDNEKQKKRPKPKL